MQACGQRIAPPATALAQLACAAFSGLSLDISGEHMNATMTGTALTLHDLGLAAGLGGSLFGQLALHPAVRRIDSRKERGEILNQAWRNYSPANAFGIVAV